MADRPWSGRGPVPPGGWSDAELEAALRDLGERLAYPATPDIAAAVRRRLAVPPPGRAPWPRRLAAWWEGLSPRRAFATAALALLLVGAVVLALIPTARETVAGWFGVRGIRIVLVDETPTPAPSPTAPAATVAATPTAAPLGDNLLLGRRVTLAQAQAMVDFPIQVPETPLLGQPDEVYVREMPDGPMVTLLYYARPGLPAAAETGVGLLLVQFEAEEGSFWIEKQTTPANDVRPVPVGGVEGLWLGGSHYLMIAPDPAFGSRPRVPTPEGRPAGNVLLWEDDGVTYRLESALTWPQAVDIAETLLPFEDATPGPGS
jgi:hypothetical protein